MLRSSGSIFQSMHLWATRQVSALFFLPQDLSQLLKAAFNSSPTYRLKRKVHPESWGMHNRASNRSTPLDTVLCKVLGIPSHVGWEQQVSQDSQMKPNTQSLILSNSMAAFRAEPDPALQCHSCTFWLLSIPIANGEPVPFSSVQVWTDFPGLCCLPATCLL